MFDFDSLVVNVVDVNPRSETHGEEDVPAVDVTLHLTHSQNEAQWQEVLAELAYESEVQSQLPTEAELLEGKQVAWGQVRYNRAYEDYKVNFRISNKKIAGLLHAKLNKFVWSFDPEHGQVLKFRVQAQAKGEQMGPLAELIKHNVRLETASMQNELPLGHEEEQGA